MAQKNIIVVQNGKTTTLSDLKINTTKIDQVYARKSENDTYILVFDNRGGSVVMSRKRIAAGNWKMNPSTKGEAITLAKMVKEYITQVPEGCSCVIFPPTCFIDAVSQELVGTDIEVGAQNVHFAKSGAYTGQVSANQVISCGATWAMVGHSEIRCFVSNDNEMFRKQILNALDHGLKVMFCVGETLEERESNVSQEVVRMQLAGGLSGVTADQMINMAILYEPVWAIGTGKTATAEQANEMCEVIRRWVQDRYDTYTAENVPVCYGGSVKAANSLEIIAQPYIDGAVMGGVSLKPEFCTVVNNIFGI